MIASVPITVPHWGAEQAASLRSFLGTTTGALFLARLMYHRPSPPALPVVAAEYNAALRTAYAERLLGYEQAIQDTIALTNPDVVAQPERPRAGSDAS